jgi:hypothetical protein
MDKPAHYDVPIDVISFAKLFLTEEEFIGAMKFNALKYFFRQGRKEGTNDPKKCLDYLNQLDDDMDKDELIDILENFIDQCD